MSAREDRIHFLARRNAGRPLLEPRRGAIASILGVGRDQVRFCPLEESDDYRQRFFERFALHRQNASKITSANERKFRFVLADAAHRLVHPDEPVTAFFSDSDLVGAIELSALNLWTHGVDLLNLDRDTFCGWIKSTDSGLLLDRDERWTDHVEYEAIVWGEEWTTAFALGMQAGEGLS